MSYTTISLLLRWHTILLVLSLILINFKVYTPMIKYPNKIVYSLSLIYLIYRHVPKKLLKKKKKNFFFFLNGYFFHQK